MRVTQIVELSKARSKVYIEQEFAFVLYKGELRLYHIREGEELAEEDYNRILGEVLPKRAKLRAMNLLKNREYTTHQLRAKLKAGFYPEKVIDEALEYVASFHYTDDLRYAVDFISCYENRRSGRRINQDLQAKGIDRDIIAQAWQEWESKGGKQDEQEMIARLLEKKHFDPRTANFKEQQRMYAFLMRKGFQNDQIRRAIKFSEDNNWD